MNSFEEILARMHKRIKGDFSLMEGSFGGDILQAAASEMARIYSEEFSTVKDRAFVQTAGGQWLDFKCADYGIERKEGESDDSLRERTLAKIRASASAGNKAHYEQWATELEGVKAAEARGLLRGPGTVDLFIIPTDGVESAGLWAEVMSHVEKNRPVCADVAISYAQARPIDVSATLILSPSSSVGAVEEKFKESLADYLASIALTDKGEIISHTKIAGLLMAIEGVLDAKNLLINGSGQSLSLESGSYGVCGTCAFGESGS